MSNVIQLKRSSTPGSVPDPSSLAIGEAAVNLADQILFTKDGSGTVKVIGAGTTSNVSEGINLYFTNTRAISAFTAGTGILLESNGLITAAIESTQVESGGFLNSTLVIFPGSVGNIDYGSGESGLTTSRDAFGVSLISVYDCMEPIGRLVSGIDFGALA